MNYPIRSWFLSIAFCAFFFVVFFFFNNDSYYSVNLSSQKNQAIKNSQSQSLQISLPVIFSSNQDKILLKKPQKNILRSNAELNQNSLKTSSLSEENPPSKTNELGSKNSSQPIFAPLPEIPEEMRYEAFNSMILARFKIGKNGEVESVSLVQNSRNLKLNQLLLLHLRKWQFEVDQAGKQIEVIVRFAVE